jgi:hypothetical protein
VEGVGLDGLSAAEPEVLRCSGVLGREVERLLVVGTSGVEVVACIGGGTAVPFRPLGGKEAADCSWIAAAFAGDRADGLSIVGVSALEGGVLAPFEGL